VQQAWEQVMPILETWQNTPDETFPNYSAGTQGPASSDRMFATEGGEWRKI
jgi:glucose-6-phosphate 1-dehydrogenase